MDERQALTSFAALSQDTRLAIVRTLVVAGPEGLAAGLIAERMGVSRQTFGRILAQARKKVACALIGGKALRIALPGEDSRDSRVSTDH